MAVPISGLVRLHLPNTKSVETRIKRVVLTNVVVERTVLMLSELAHALHELLVLFFGCMRTSVFCNDRRDV